MTERYNFIWFTATGRHWFHCFNKISAHISVFFNWSRIVCHRLHLVSRTSYSTYTLAVMGQILSLFLKQWIPGNCYFLLKFTREVFIYYTLLFFLLSCLYLEVTYQTMWMAVTIYMKKIVNQLLIQCVSEWIASLVFWNRPLIF